MNPLFDDHVMSPEQIRKYVFDRLFWNGISTEQVVKVRKVVVHNAQETDNVKAMLSGKDYMLYTPPESRESHFYLPDEQEIHVVNPKGWQRLQREENLAAYLKAVLEHFPMYWNHKLEKESIELMHPGNAPFRTGTFFDNLAYDLIKDLSLKLNAGAVSGKKAGDSKAYIMGPFESLEEALKEDKDTVLYPVQKNEYLNYRFLTMGDSLAVAFDYVFGDQAYNILRWLFSAMNVRGRESGKKESAGIYHFGKAGVLGTAKEDCIVMPTGAIEEADILQGRAGAQHPIRNALAEEPGTRAAFQEYLRQQGYGTAAGVTLSSASVLNQRRSTLRRARAEGADIVEMEWLPIAQACELSRMGGLSIGEVKCHLAGAPSDWPLEGKTLADTLYDRKGEVAIVRAYKERIMRG